jgi:hypothetical protein
VRKLWCLRSARRLFWHPGGPIVCLAAPMIFRRCGRSPSPRGAPSDAGLCGTWRTQQAVLPSSAATIPMARLRPSLWMHRVATARSGSIIYRRSPNSGARQQETMHIDRLLMTSENFANMQEIICIHVSAAGSHLGGGVSPVP